MSEEGQQAWGVWYEGVAGGTLERMRIGADGELEWGWITADYLNALETREGKLAELVERAKEYFVEREESGMGYWLAEAEALMKANDG
jgi:hypothetical protein